MSKLRQFLLRMQVRPGRISTTRVIAVSFAVIILLGTLLLMLPAASRNGISAGFTKALFTATSSTCVTGLVLADTFTQWSGFGQIVILALIQVGGLGFMSVAAIFVFSMHKRFGMKQRMLLAQAMSLSDLEGVVRLEKHVLIGTFSIEALGAVILFLRFLPQFGLWNSVKWGVFHSISAFCNAGFDIFGCLKPDSSLTLFQTDPVVCITIMLLITVGGLGFFVWEDLWNCFRSHNLCRLSAYSKLVLACTGIIFLLGTAGICVLEWKNPATLGAMTVPQKLLAGSFQAVTTRTAGFAAIDQGAMGESSRAFSILLMLIGGSSGSTAGGIKTATVAVLILAAIASARGQSHTRVFHRTVSDRQIRDATSLAVCMLALTFLGAMILGTDQSIGFLNALFESASALATVGLSAGVTPLLSGFGKLLIIVYMYFGRVGILTISLGFLMGDRAVERYRYAEAKLLIG